MEDTAVQGYVEIKPAATTYKDRFLVEYEELKDRYTKLHRMIVKYDAKTLDFTPTCPIELLRQQKSLMGNYLNVLEIRAEIAGIKLPDTV